MLIYENIEFGSPLVCKQGDKIPKIRIFFYWRVKYLLFIVKNYYAMSTSTLTGEIVNANNS